MAAQRGCGVLSRRETLSISNRRGGPQRVTVINWLALLASCHCSLASSSEVARFSLRTYYQLIDIYRNLSENMPSNVASVFTAEL